MKSYYKFSQKHFEYGVREFLIKNKLGFMSEITEEFQKENVTKERIYKITTKNPSVDIIVFSSVDVRTKSVRDHSADAVRLVLRWKTKNGYVYKKLAKHLRIETLFNNMKKSVEKAQCVVFKLNYKEFTNKLN